MKAAFYCLPFDLKTKIKHAFAAIDISEVD